MFDSQVATAIASSQSHSNLGSQINFSNSVRGSYEVNHTFVVVVVAVTHGSTTVTEGRCRFSVTVVVVISSNVVVTGAVVATLVGGLAT
tara:strand:- start:248 stop:514 length:267 start_codon:yes stop_codon:yes gene_type:complete